MTFFIEHLGLIEPQDCEGPGPITLPMRASPIPQQDESQHPYNEVVMDPLDDGAIAPYRSCIDLKLNLQNSSRSGEAPLRGMRRSSMIFSNPSLLIEFELGNSSRHACSFTTSNSHLTAEIRRSTFLRFNHAMLQMIN